MFHWISFCWNILFEFEFDRLDEGWKWKKIAKMSKYICNKRCIFHNFWQLLLSLQLVHKKLSDIIFFCCCFWQNPILDHHCSKSKSLRVSAWPAPHLLLLDFNHHFWPGKICQFVGSRLAPEHLSVSQRCKNEIHTMLVSKAHVFHLRFSSLLLHF